MNELKKDIQALRQYLGKDKEGLALLDKLSRTANEYRKQANTEVERTADARQRLRKANEELTGQKNRNRDLQQESFQWQSKIRHHKLRRWLKEAFEESQTPFQKAAVQIHERED